MVYVPLPEIVPLPLNTPHTAMSWPLSLIQKFALARRCNRCDDVTFQPSRPRYVQCRPVPFTHFLASVLPRRSRIQIVPLDISPHSAPLATMLSVPVPSAR